MGFVMNVDCTLNCAYLLIATTLYAFIVTLIYAWENTCMYTHTRKHASSNLTQFVKSTRGFVAL